MMRIVLLAWVEPTEGVINQIEEKHPTGHIQLIRRWRLSTSLFRFVQQQNHLGIQVLYLLCRDLDESSVPYLLGLGLFSNAEITKIVDLNGREQNCSWGSFLSRGIHRIVLEIPWAILIFLYNWVVLKFLNNRWSVRLARVYLDKSSFVARSGKPNCIGFFWSEIADNNFDFNVGGEISHIVGFFGGLKRLGYEAFMVSTRPILHDRFAASNEVIGQQEIPSWPGEIRQMAYNWKMLWKSRKLMYRWQPSLIYHRTSSFSFIGVLLSVCYRIPLIIEVNSSEVWKAKNWSKVRFPRMLERTEQISHLYASKVAVVSDEIRDYLIKHGVAPNKIIVNPNGVDTDFFYPYGNGKKIAIEYGLKNKILVGFIGSFNLYHGILTLARAIKLVARKIENIHFLIIGDGKLRSEFQDIIRSDNVSSYVTLTGKLAHEKVPAFLDACDILVSPHQNMEDGSTFFGSPTKVFEYMAMDKGIIASNVGQLGQILKHEETALLVNPEDPEDLAKGIIRLARNEALRETLGRNARKQVVASYTWEKNVERVISPIFGEKG